MYTHTHTHTHTHTLQVNVLYASILRKCYIREDNMEGGGGREEVEERGGMKGRGRDEGEEEEG